VNLDENNIMDYFYASPFYEKNSINHICYTQKIDFNSKKFYYSGIEFNIESVDKEKDLFVINKCFRKNFKESTLISYYYIFKGTIYQSPDVYSVIISNVESIAHNFNTIINEINTDE
jgi:hypothetical protein